MSMPARILLPLDLSPPGEAKIPVAAGYARAFGAELVLLHLIPRSATFPVLGDLRTARRREALENTRDVPSPTEASARAYLDTVAAKLRATGVRAQPMVREGPVAATVLDVARQEAIGLIIIGSNLRPGLSRLVLGDTAQAIVRGAPCPTLLVRPEMAGAVAPPVVRSFTDDATRAGLLVPRTLGWRTVAVARIIGSVGKASELGGDFRPLYRSTGESQRYSGLRDLSAGTTSNEGVGLPPIDLYKLGYGYYVLDGHRRVAAAKELGQDDIDADVTEFLPTQDPDAQRAFTARRVFERATGLTRIGATRPQTYERLQGLLSAWVARHAADLGRREAAERWYSKVFRPQAKQIRTLRLNRHFPGERTADIFVRLADHRAAEVARQGRKVGWEEALDTFSARAQAGGAREIAEEPNAAEVASDPPE